jgi:hypothetical protein
MPEERIFPAGVVVSVGGIPSWTGALAYDA